MNRLRSKLTYANIVASLALFAACAGGTAFAAAQFEKESIGTNALKKGAVTPAKLSSRSKATLTGPQGPKGSAGAQGPQGSQGLKGDRGEPATSLLAHVSASAVLIGGSGVTGVTPGEKGTVVVDFNRDVSGCNLEATPASSPGIAPGGLIVQPSEGDPAGVLVERVKSAGGGAEFAFYLAVFCP